MIDESNLFFHLKIFSICVLIKICYNKYIVTVCVEKQWFSEVNIFKNIQ